MDENFPYEDDKIGGVPAWLEDPEYCECNKCDEDIKNECNVFVLQIEPIILDMEWVGIGYMHCCKYHPKVLSFGFQNYRGW